MSQVIRGGNTHSHLTLGKTVRAIPKLTWCLVVLVCMIGAVSCTSSSVRIDGSSPEAFRRTNAEMLQSLSPSDQTKLVGAELYICAAAAKDSSSGHSPVAPVTGFSANFSAKPIKISVPAPVREELNGKTFEEILQDAKAKPRNIEGRVEVEFSTKSPSSHH